MNEPADGEDGTKYVQMYGLTRLGEPICINEYAANISANYSTQVLLFEDWQSDTAALSNINHVNPNS